MEHTLSTLEKKYGISAMQVALDCVRQAAGQWPLYLSSDEARWAYDQINPQAFRNAVLWQIESSLQNLTAMLRAGAQDKTEPDAEPHPTIESFYGKPLAELKAPAGYALTREFRPIKGAEIWLDPATGEALRSVDPKAECRESFLILRKLKRLVFDIVREDSYPRAGELFSGGQVVERAKFGIFHHLPMDLILSEPRVEE